MKKFIQSKWTILVLIITVITVLGKIPTTRDTACDILGIALASEAKQTQKQLSNTIDTLQKMVEFQKFLLQITLPDTLRKQGMDSAAVDTFMKLIDQKWDSLMNGKKEKP